MSHHPTAWPGLTGLAATLVLALPAQAQVIDDFEGSFGSQTAVFAGVPSPFAQLEVIRDAAVPGGTRRLQLLADTAAAGTTSVALSGSGDLWAFASGGQRTAFNVAYGTERPMDLDLSAAGALRIDVYYSSPMKLVVYASTQTTPGANPDASAVAIDLPDLFRQTVDIPLSSFVTNSATGLPVRWSDVDGLAFFVSANGPLPPSGDGFWISQISAVPVPEPASAWLWLAGVAGLAGRLASGRRMAGGWQR